ncbi:hypothetical protein J3459_022522 [Metarhizium acridum]|nr:hypothetical protein J3459_022522 [Metarhizium acridum]
MHSRLFFRHESQEGMTKPKADMNSERRLRSIFWLGRDRCFETRSEDIVKRMTKKEKKGKRGRKRILTGRNEMALRTRPMGEEYYVTNQGYLKQLAGVMGRQHADKNGARRDRRSREGIRWDQSDPTQWIRGDQPDPARGIRWDLSDPGLQ